MNEPEFYVGYAPRAPHGIAGSMKRSAIALLLIAAVVAIVLVVAQEPFADSRFEWGQSREFAGVVRATPVPMLVGSQPYLLVGVGKRGISVAGFDGRRVRFRGSLIERDDQRAIEVLPDTVTAGAAADSAVATVVLGAAALTGEIVDSKCYFGVMNPGSGKVHRDCAVRCISGGVPPAFLVRDRNGRARTMLLASETGESLVPRILSRVAEPVRLSGTLMSADGVLIFRIRE